MVHLYKDWVFRRRIIATLQKGNPLSDDDLKDPRTIDAQDRFARSERRRAAKYFRCHVEYLWPVAQNPNPYPSSDNYSAYVSHALKSVELSRASAVLNSMQEAECALPDSPRAHTSE
jgi:hypothetical protein